MADPPTSDAPSSDGRSADPPFPDPDSRNVLLPGCARCPGLPECRERVAWGNGPLDADVVVVGEAPAAGEPAASGDPTRERGSAAERWRGGNWTGMAYTSRHSGRRIRSLFAELGYEPYYTNAVKCFPEDEAASGESATNREPTGAERRRCSAHLRTELLQVEPTVVVPTGKHATSSVLSLAGEEVEGFLDLVLEPLGLEGVEPTVLPVLHPSYQEVWVSRLGYSAAEYRSALGARLDDLV